MDYMHVIIKKVNYKLYYSSQAAVTDSLIIHTLSIIEWLYAFINHINVCS